MSAISPKDADFSRLDDSEHMLSWLGPDPYAHILDEVESLLGGMAEGAQLVRFEAMDNAEFITGAASSADVPGDDLVWAKSIFAFPFKLTVNAPGRGHDDLDGVYSKAAIGLHRPPGEQNSQVWFDLNGTMAEFGEFELMKQRLLSLSA